MAIIFYPHDDDLHTNSAGDKLEVLMGAAERYKAIILEMAAKTPELSAEQKKRNTPKEAEHAFNWEELAKLLRELRELPENNQTNRLSKAEKLQKLSEVYEVLRGAKMPKLEAVRLALVNEVKQLRTSTAA